MLMKVRDMLSPSTLFAVSSQGSTPQKWYTSGCGTDAPNDSERSTWWTIFDKHHLRKEYLPESWNMCNRMGQLMISANKEEFNKWYIWVNFHQESPCPKSLLDTFLYAWMQQCFSLTKSSQLMIITQLKLISQKNCHRPDHRKPGGHGCLLPHLLHCLWELWFYTQSERITSTPINNTSKEKGCLNTESGEALLR